MLACRAVLFELITTRKMRVFLKFPLFSGFKHPLRDEYAFRKVRIFS